MKKSDVDRLRDYEAYANAYLKIKTKDGNLAPLVFNRAQRQLWRDTQELMTKGREVRLAILKGRQLGVTTWTQGLTFWRTVTRRNTHSLVVAHNTESTLGIFKMAKLMHEELPDLLRPMVRRSSRKELLFENPNDRQRQKHPGLRSLMELRTAGNEEAGRGLTYHCLHLSEVASWPEPELLVMSLFPTVPNLAETIIVLESTAKGGGTWWHDFYVKSRAGKTGFSAVFLGWYLADEYRLSEEETKEWIPSTDDYDNEEHQLAETHGLSIEQLAFRRKKISAQGEDFFRQEFPGDENEAWLGIGAPVFNRERTRLLYEDALLEKPIVSGDINRQTGEIIESDDSDAPLRIWAHPEPGKQYVIGVDTAAGAEGGNQSAVSVLLRGASQKHVATWAQVVSGLQLVPIIETLGWMYNEAMVSVEINFNGISVQEALNRVYTNLYRWRYLDRRTLAPTEKIGWQTTYSTKPLLITHMQHMFEQELFTTHDPIFLRQVYGYSWVDSAREIAMQEPGQLSDILMATMIASFTDYLDQQYDRPHVHKDQQSAPVKPENIDPIYTDMAPDPWAEEGGW